jgi:tRNA(adenine34) deaminase
MDQNRHEYWMNLALQEAGKALEAGEVPIAAILVANDTELGRSQTLVVRHESWAAHAELFSLLNTKKLWLASKPITMYTTLEPCFLCFGAMMECGVDRIVWNESNFGWFNFFFYWKNA